MVNGKRQAKLVADMTAGIHRIIADAPVALGGSDQGPGPHEIFEASLVACTIITLQMYADRHQWNLDSAEVTVKIDKEGAESHLTREVKLIGDLSDEQRDKLFEIADKCPIHKLMSSHISISTVRH